MIISINHNTFKLKKYDKLLFSLMVILGGGAIFGGAVFMLSPSGKLFGMPLSMLDNSPFRNFLIPGIILFAVLGVAPILTAIALTKKRPNELMEKFNLFPDIHWSWSFSIYIAVALIIWIQVEMYFLQMVHWAHLLYMGIALVILYTALLPGVRQSYKKLT